MTAPLADSTCWIRPSGAAHADPGAQAQGRRGRRRGRPSHRPAAHGQVLSKAKTEVSTCTPLCASLDEELRPKPSGDQCAQGVSLRVEAGVVVELVDVLHGDDVALHAHHLGQVSDVAGTVLEPRLLHHQVDGAGDLLADRPYRQVHAGHEHHRLDAGQRVARGVGVHGADGAVVAGVHGLEHVEGCGVADLADDDAVGAHAQGVLDQVADR